MYQVPSTRYHGILVVLPLYTSWASQGAARAVERLWPAQYYVFGCEFLTRRWSFINQQTESLPFFFLVREIWPIQRSEKNTTTKKRPYTVTCPKKHNKKSSIIHLCAHAMLQIRLVKMSDRNWQNWAGHRSDAACSPILYTWYLVYVSCTGTFFLS